MVVLGVTGAREERGRVHSAVGEQRAKAISMISSEPHKRSERRKGRLITGLAWDSGRSGTKGLLNPARSIISTSLEFGRTWKSLDPSERSHAFRKLQAGSLSASLRDVYSITRWVRLDGFSDQTALVGCIRHFLGQSQSFVRRSKISLVSARQ
ncbi:uncharacterized protein LOC112351516 isoform X2 [Selaginella moellendorffii]|uniref:uncharacterized protein LOC112351516 isoform X2 n=1 Tax=Selaginella moellendorffii TaxID=88036 RepID=UPI000D1C37FE|nr:uncharacterized protein LOC112351516 isoform X2 [Selaginella moellendorffii]|eukprot:XP_024545298.1 uncharacterized protein LOC112351516 isoform X2 [Selaginella moellendorffii]